MGTLGESGERFLDNQRIEGNIMDMLDEAVKFVKRNMRTKTIINQVTGKREDKTDYLIPAIREAIINALVHRDYSIHIVQTSDEICSENKRTVNNCCALFPYVLITYCYKITVMIHPTCRQRIPPLAVF